MSPADTPCPVQRVLIVEDDRDVREAIAEILEDNAFQTIEAANGADALNRLRELPASPCVILLDIMMPVMDGREFRAIQRDDPALNGIPVVVLSAHANLDEASQQMSVQACLKKPVPLDVLLETVRHFCRGNGRPSAAIGSTK